MKFIDRSGEINHNKYGTEMKIIKYNNANDIIVEFQDDYKYKVHTSYSAFKKGEIKNPYDKSLLGIAYLGVGKYNTRVNNKRTDIYNEWSAMINRCYNPKYLKKEPSYIDCKVCNEWLCFQNYAEWRENNYYKIKNEKMHLDKDILIKGNKIYSPQTCIFVPQRINNLFTKNQSIRGRYPIGILWHKRDEIFEVKCSIFDKTTNKKK